MKDRFAQAADFEFAFIDDTDLLPEDCYVSAPSDVGADSKRRPPSGHYLGLASGASTAQLDLSALGPLE
eukprot:12188667-Alexandrium_andersonii.AAC.1